MRWLVFFTFAAGAGVVWYFVLSLPVSPVSHSVLRGTFPSPGVALYVCIASVVAASPLIRIFRSRHAAVVVAGGVAYTLLAGMVFAMLMLSGGFAVWPPPVSEVIIMLFVVPAYGLLYALLSGHVALPVGIAFAFLYRRILVDHASGDVGDGDNAEGATP